MIEILEIIVPLILLFVIVLVKKIPKIGGNVRIALLISAASSAIISGLGPKEIVLGIIDGVDQLSWVIMLSIVGSIYAMSQEKLGAINTTLDGLRSIFGNSPKGLITSVFITLMIAGSFLGDAIAASAVIGFLVIHALDEIKLKPEHIGMIILLGASIGSVMPPITQAVFLSSSLIATDPTPVIKIAYVTVGIGGVLAILESFRFIRVKSMPEHLKINESIFNVLKGRWKTLIPLTVLFVIVLASTLFNYDIFSEWAFLSVIIDPLKEIPIIQGLTFHVVLAIIAAIIVSFFFGSIRKETKAIFKSGIKNISRTAQIQVCAGVMVGVFYASGLIDKVAFLTGELSATFIKIGGTISLLIVGMITGSQSTAQSTILPFLGPLLENMNVDPTFIALGASHIAGAGQNLPPVGLTAFVICGLIGGILNKEVDPFKVMMLTVPNTIYFVGVGIAVWFFF